MNSWKSPHPSTACPSKEQRHNIISRCPRTPCGGRRELRVTMLPPITSGARQEIWQRYKRSLMFENEPAEKVVTSLPQLRGRPTVPKPRPERPRADPTIVGNRGVSLRPARRPRSPYAAEFESAPNSRAVRSRGASSQARGFWRLHSAPSPRATCHCTCRDLS